MRDVDSFCDTGRIVIVINFFLIPNISLFYIWYDISLILNYISGRGNVMGSLLAKIHKCICIKLTAYIT